jgi:hypothetical protein
MLMLYYSKKLADIHSRRLRITLWSYDKYFRSGVQHSRAHPDVRLLRPRTHPQ